MKSLFYWINRVILLPTVAVCTVSCAPSQDIDLKLGFTLTTEEVEHGQKGARLLESMVLRYPDQQLNDYVRRILSRILAALPENQISFRVTVLDSAELNARAFSNGQLFVNRNLLAHLCSESELAALLAHEVAHVVLRHVRREIKKSEKMKQFARRLESKGATVQMQQIADTFGEAMTQGYNREMELEADRFAVKLLRKAGYNSVGMFNLLEILAHNHAEDMEIIQRMGINPLRYTKGVFNDHPHAAIRIASIRKNLSRLILKKGISQEDRNRYLKNIEGLVIDNYPADGLIKKGHYICGKPGVRFKIPEDWSYRLIPGSELVLWPDSQKGTYLHFYALSSDASENASAQSEAESDQGLRFDPWREIDVRVVNDRLMRLFETRVSDDQRPVKAALIVGAEAQFIFQIVNANADANRIFLQTVESFSELSVDEINKLDPNHISLDALCPDGVNDPLCVKQQSWLNHNVTALRLNGYFGKSVNPNPGDLIKHIK